ncbi:MAG: HD domain-containing protein [Lewinellaceae bacterium]|nr:HD domain-containing protein [Lewinellaceae bacterium]
MYQGKIFNDPIYGLIRFPHSILYKIIDHPYFQRLRRISQQALSHYVYPGAMHTRFQHALGALHLMTRAIDVLKSKGVSISKEESEAVSVAILLHDIGHGPFSHALEQELVPIHHEDISKILIEQIGIDLNADFSLALQMFDGQYHRPFFHDLISGNIDMDRMDYLTRDSYFSGVAEGIIGYDRIITMLNVWRDSLVIEEKAIYSIEKFLMARRLMYHQVYLHKTVVSAELMLKSITQRLKYLVSSPQRYQTYNEGINVLLKGESANSNSKEDILKWFVHLDDTDILQVIKQGQGTNDMILSKLCSNLLERNLFKLSLSSESDENSDLSHRKKKFIKKYKIKEDELFYFFPTKSETIEMYSSLNGELNVLDKSDSIKSFSEFISDREINRREIKEFKFYSQ